MSSKALFNIDRLIQIRRHFHKYPESSFQEWNTSKKIKEYLLDLGINESDIQVKASTGLMIDVKGTSKAIGGVPRIIAFRADIDALEMIENNPELEYKSVNNCGHMCGHDGHITCLLGGISLMMENIDQFPSDRTARFIFQPAEEKFGGASQMVKEGCMNGVSEVWGMHNIPLNPMGKVLVKPGTMMSEVTNLRITYKGKGGHSSLKAELNDPTLPACELLIELEKLLESEFAEENNKTIIFNIPSFKGSVTHNVIPDEVVLAGNIRAFDLPARNKLYIKFTELVHRIGDKHKVQTLLENPFSYPMTINNEKLAHEMQNMMETSTDHLPLKASEDFSEFANVVPGCFFLFCIGTQAGKSLHVNNYNFNDEAIEPASQNWFKILKNRLTR